MKTISFALFLFQIKQIVSLHIYIANEPNPLFVQGCFLCTKKKINRGPYNIAE